MSNIKKYDVGQIKFDMFPESYDHDGPYVSYTHELPLLSFSDVQHSVNLSLVFNYDRYREEKEKNTNPFFIAPGYKLNLQKRLIYDLQDIPTTFQGENGKNIELNKASNNVFTFNDESQRILRRTSSALTVEYPDFSKEDYNETGRITQAYDKYSDCPVLTYSYNVYNQLVSIVFRNSKVIYLAYESNRLKSIRYNGKVTTFYYNDDGTLDYIKHYTDVKYKFTLSKVNCGSYEIELPYKVTAFEDDTATLASKELNLVNLGKTVEIIDKIGDNPVNIISYKHSRSLIDYIPPFEYVDIVDNNGVETRTQFQDGKPFCSYIVKDGNPQFSDDSPQNIFCGSVTLYNAGDASNYESNHEVQIRNKGISGVQNVNDGNQMGYISDSNKWIWSIAGENKMSGSYTLSGWIRVNTDNVQQANITIGTSNEGTTSFCVDPYIVGQWKYFSLTFHLNWHTVNVHVANEEAISTRDFRLTYNGPDLKTESNVSNMDMSEHVLFNGTEEISFNDAIFYYCSNNDNYEIKSDEEEDRVVTFSDVMRYKLRKKRDGVANEVYYNQGNNAVTGTTDLMVLHNDNFISIGSLDLGIKVCSDNKKSLTRINVNENNQNSPIVKTHTVNGVILSTEKLNNNLDVIESTTDGITTNYVFNADGLIIRESVPLLYIKDISYDNTVITVKDIDPTTEAELANTKYYLDSVWGSLERIVPSDNSIIRYYYDNNSRALTQMSFGVNPLRKNILGYSNNRLESLESGSLNYAFKYISSDGKLNKIIKNQENIENHTYSTIGNETTVYSKYPSSDNPLRTEETAFDKYGKLKSIAGVLENTYDVNPRFYYEDSDNPFNYNMESYDRATHGNLKRREIGADVGGAPLAQTTDNLTGEVTKYGYHDGNLTAAVTYNAAGSVLKQETFVYDDADRLTSERFEYDLTTGDKVRSDITYVRSADNPLVDSRIDTYTYKVNGIEKAKTQNTYDNYKRIKSKAYTVGGKIFTQSAGYDGKALKRIWDSMGNSTSYQYDCMDRITSVNNGNPITYEYDTYGQLIRENNKILDKTFVYEYNDIGNIISVKTYNYTTEALGAVIDQQDFGYDTTHPDRLTRCGSTDISYNAMGCPVTYDCLNISWTRGKISKLSCGDKLSGTKTYNYNYNAFGQRIGRTYLYTPATGIGSVGQEGILTSSNRTFNYDNSGRLISESNTSVYYGEGSETAKISYLYDENSIVGMLYTANGVTNAYYFQRNLLGDVIGIYNTSGTKVGGYAYDAWGNCTITLNTNGIATRNPIRYRGYYYDADTNLYYLNARYYSPELRRFISPDDTAYLDPETPNGLNLYCYCGNDPVNYADPSGCSSVLAIILCGIAVVGLGLTIGGVASDNNLVTAIGLTMVAVTALISGVGTFFSGAIYLGIIGGATAVAGIGTSLFASAEYQEALTGNNWMIDAGVSEEWYNGLMLTTATLATAGTIATGVLTSIGNAATPNQMIDSISKHPNRWKQVNEAKDAATGRKYKGATSYYRNYINKWTGSRSGSHIIVRDGKILHKLHYHSWIVE